MQSISGWMLRLADGRPMSTLLRGELDDRGQARRRAGLLALLRRVPVGVDPHLGHPLDRRSPGPAARGSGATGGGRGGIRGGRRVRRARHRAGGEVVAAGLAEQRRRVAGRAAVRAGLRVGAALGAARSGTSRPRPGPARTGSGRRPRTARSRVRRCRRSTGRDGDPAGVAVVARRRGVPVGAGEGAHGASLRHRQPAAAHPAVTSSPASSWWMPCRAPSRRACSTLRLRRTVPVSASSISTTLRSRVVASSLPVSCGELHRAAELDGGGVGRRRPPWRPGRPGSPRPARPARCSARPRGRCAW